MNRVIPVLLLSNSGLVKTTKFKNPKYIGDPINAVRIFNEKEVDELVVLDIDATRQGREPDYELIEEVASECFMPLAYGGGVKSMEQAKRLFKLGIEKVVLQDSAMQNHEIISEMASCFGSQSIVVSVDLKRDWIKRPRVWSSKLRKIYHKNDWLVELKRFQDAGAGEIILNSVDRDGCQTGYDYELISQASDILDIPLVVLGGAGLITDFRLAIQAGASAVAAGSMFVFEGKYRAVLINYPGYEQLQIVFAS